MSKDFIEYYSSLNKEQREQLQDKLRQKRLLNKKQKSIWLQKLMTKSKDDFKSIPIIKEQPTKPDITNFDLSTDYNDEYDGIKQKLLKMENLNAQNIKKIESSRTILLLLFIYGIIVLGIAFGKNGVISTIIFCVSGFLFYPLPKKLRLNDILSNNELELFNKLQQYEEALKLYHYHLHCYNSYQQEKDIRKNIDKHNLTPRGFEILCSNIFAEKGYNVILTKPEKDGGVDIIIEKEGKKKYIECKYHKKPIGVKIVRELFGVITAEKIESGVIIALYDFTKEAYKFAYNTKSIQLIRFADIDRVFK